MKLVPSCCSNDLKCVVCYRRLSVAIEFPHKYKYYSIYIIFLRYKYFLLTTTHSLISTFYCSLFKVQVLFTDINIITVFTTLLFLLYSTTEV